MTTAYLGVDLGTSSVKVVAVTAAGAVLASSRHAYPTTRPEPSAAEQDPADWWAATLACLAELAAAVPPDGWAGIGLSGMLPTLVELDDDFEPAGPAITWEDGRAEHEASAIVDAVGATEIYEITGQRLDGRYLAPMHARRVRLGTADNAVAGAKDWLFRQFTGVLLTDPSTAAGYGTYDLNRAQWNPLLTTVFGLPALPRIEPSTTSLPLLPALCDEFGCAARLPVVLGAADSVLGTVGLGLEVGDVAIISGTSTVVLARSDRIVLDPQQRYLVTPLATAGFGMEMDLLATGSAVAWLADLLRFDGPDDLVLAASAEDPARAPVFLPYVAPGEQGALWNPDLTGVVRGLHLGTTRAQVARGLLNGIVLELARCIAVLSAACGASGAVRLGGRGALVRQLQLDVADATGRAVTVSDSADQSAIGAAALAARVVDDARLPVATSGEPVFPRPQRVAMWAALEAAHERVRTADAAMLSGQSR